MAWLLGWSTLNKAIILFTLKERNLRKRGSETEDHIEARLRHAKEDMATARQVDFDLVIVNQVVEKAFEQFCAFVQPVSVCVCVLVTFVWWHDDDDDHPD